MWRKSNKEIQREKEIIEYRENIKKLNDILILINYNASLQKTIIFEDYETDNDFFNRPFDREIEVNKTMIEIVFEHWFIESLSKFCYNLLDNKWQELTSIQKNNIENIFNGLLEKDALDNPIKYIYDILFIKK